VAKKSFFSSKTILPIKKDFDQQRYFPPKNFTPSFFSSKNYLCLPKMILFKKIFGANCILPDFQFGYITWSWRQSVFLETDPISVPPVVKILVLFFFLFCFPKKNIEMCENIQLSVNCINFNTKKKSDNFFGQRSNSPLLTVKKIM